MLPFLKPFHTVLVDTEVQLWLVLLRTVDFAKQNDDVLHQWDFTGIIKGSIWLVSEAGKCSL